MWQGDATVELCRNCDLKVDCEQLEFSGLAVIKARATTELTQNYIPTPFRLEEKNQPQMHTLILNHRCTRFAKQHTPHRAHHSG